MGVVSEDDRGVVVQVKDSVMAGARPTRGLTAKSLTFEEGAPVRALLADSNALFRVGLKRVLHALGIAVVGEASNGRDAVRLASELRPDVVVIDTELPILSGLEATRLISELPDAPPVMVLAGAQTTDVLDALLAGAGSFLFKNCDAQVLADGIKRAAAGEATLAASVTSNLVERLRELEAARRLVTPHRSPVLTTREQQVLRLVANGCDNNSIGSELYISASTVKHHVAAILDKLHASNRAQAAAEAVRIGLA